MNAHNCFPESWIGKEPVMVGDGSTYFIDNDSSKQINLPSNYKGIRAVWLNNGVLRIDTNMNNTKLFYVGYQRYFEAYQNETEPHDQYSYQEAVKECQRLRAEEAERNNPKRDSGSIDRKNKSEKSSKTKGVGLGLGTMIGSAVSAVKDFRSIDDSSSLEEKGNQIMQNMLNNMAERNRRSEEESKKWQKEYDRRTKIGRQELDKISKIEQRFYSKERKKRIFSNLHNAFIHDKAYLYDDVIYKFSGIYDPESMEAVSRAMRAYRQSLKEVGRSEKFYQCWSEIIYLIKEGIMFKDDHVEYFTKLIKNTCGQGEMNESGEVESFDDFLKMCYSKLEYAYWGYNFEKDPKEDKLEERKRYINHWMHSDEDYVDFNYDEYEDELGNNEKDEENENNVEKIINDEGDDPDLVEDEEEEKHVDNPQVTKSCGLSNTKYEDLESTEFKKDNSKEDYKEPKNAFDLISKSKNKKISNKKEKWNDAMWNLDHKLKKNVLRDLIKIEKDVVKLLKLEEELRELLESGKSEGFWGFGGDKNVKKKKSDIKDIKERIVEHKEKLEDSVEELHDCEEDIKDLQEDLYELTGLEKYANFKPLEGKGIGIANQLIKSIKDTDSKTLKELLEL